MNPVFKTNKKKSHQALLKVILLKPSLILWSFTLGSFSGRNTSLIHAPCERLTNHHSTSIKKLSTKFPTEILPAVSTASRENVVDV